jgi:two-component system phosphate regulon sensor histidine kinase PhoR
MQKRRKRLLWQLYAFYLAITVISLIAVTWYASHSFRQFYLVSTANDLEVKAHFLERQFLQYLLLANAKEVDLLCKELGQQTYVRITVLASDGKVLGDSEADPTQMDNHANRPEIITTRSSSRGVSCRYSNTVKTKMMYVGVPVNQQEKIIGFIRIAIPITSIDQALQEIHLKIILGGLAIVLVVALVSFALFHHLKCLLDEMKRGAERFARGELSSRLKVPDCEEIASLAP